ncbi:MAG: TonB-dependent receptor [Bacteroidota bacterium]|nr:TonB-dependent receptor [Bacteroidota bacterium]
MKTKILLLSICCFSFGLLNAQVFIGFGVGYSEGISRKVLGYNSEDNNVANTYFTENVKGSYGRGTNLNVYVGYMLNDVVGFELAGNYLYGGEYYFKSVDINPGTTSTLLQNAYATSIRIIPGFRLCYGENELRYYSRVALALGIANKLIVNYERTTTNGGGTDINEQTFVYSGGNYIGFTGAFGLTYALSERVAVYGELTRYFISWGATEGEYTVSTRNGVDELGNMTTSEKYFEFEDRVDQTMNNNPGEPTKFLKSYSPLNSLGLNVGLHFTF